MVAADSNYRYQTEQCHVLLKHLLLPHSMLTDYILDLHMSSRQSAQAEIGCTSSNAPRDYHECHNQVSVTHSCPKSTRPQRAQIMHSIHKEQPHYQIQVGTIKKNKNCMSYLKRQNTVKAGQYEEKCQDNITAIGHGMLLQNPIVSF